MSNIKPLTYAFIDTETTGLDEKIHGLIQVACIIRTDEKIIATKVIKIKPPEGTQFEQSALDINGMTVDEIMHDPERLEYYDALKEFTEFLSQFVNQYDKEDKLIFAAYNAPFDDRFVRAWFTACENNFYGSFFWNPAFCIMQMALVYLRPIRPQLPRFNLRTLCEVTKVGWDEAKAHDAVYDIIKTSELYDYLILNYETE